ncbi:hypothetical protein CHU98_g10754, partial [Xylaria longipes]
QILGAQYAVYTAIRKEIHNLLLVHRSVKREVERYYKFLEPFPKTESGISSPLGYWVHPEHDVVTPAHYPYWSPPISPSPAFFPWSRVRYLHLRGRGEFMKRKYKAVITHLPNLKQVCLITSAQKRGTPKAENGENPHTATMDSLVRLEKHIAFEDQGSIGVEPPHSRTPLTSSDVLAVLQWSRERGIGVVELDNTCHECPHYYRPYSRPDNAYLHAIEEYKQVAPWARGRRPQMSDFIVD